MSDIDAESDLLRELSQELDSLSDFEDDGSYFDTSSSKQDGSGNATSVAVQIQGISQAIPAETALRQQPPEQCKLASRSVSMSPVHRCDRLLSPSSTATLAAVCSPASSCLQPSVPIRASTSCTSMDTDALHHVDCSAVPEPSKGFHCHSSNLPPWACASTSHAACHTATRRPRQQQQVSADHRPGEDTSEPRGPQKKRPRVRNRATAVCFSSRLDV